MQTQANRTRVCGEDRQPQVSGDVMLLHRLSYSLKFSWVTISYSNDVQSDSLDLSMSFLTRVNCVRMEANTQREVAALRQCESHPNIVKLQEVYTDQVQWRKPMT